MPQNRQIVVIGNFKRDGQWSMQKFAEMMTASLVGKAIPVELLYPTAHFARLASDTGALSKWLGYLDKYVLFPRRLRRRLSAITAERRVGTLVHICDHSNSLYVDHLGGLSNVVTCHDLIAVRQARGEITGPPVRWTGRKLQRLIVQGLQRADWVACDSASTRRDLMACSGRDGERTETIHCQLNHPYVRLPAAEAWRILAGKLSRPPGAMVLHVGNNSWYKNRDGVLRIFSLARQLAPHAQPRLVIAGREFTPEQESFLEKERLTGFVQRVADLSTTELQAAYSVADVFLFPSIYEGFGWPPVEAQACGCPVVAGIGGSLAEVLEDSALKADARDESALAGHVANLLSNPEQSARLREAGLANARRFQPPVMVDQYLTLYERILAAPKGRHL